jgi:ABC-type transport system involved in cytochrome c biogenesis permease component
MCTIASLFGIDAASWGVVIAALALAVSAYSVFGARGSAKASTRSVMSVEVV